MSVTTPHPALTPTGVAASQERPEMRREDPKEKVHMLALREMLGVVISETEDLARIASTLTVLRNHRVPYRLLDVDPVAPDELRATIREAAESGIDLFWVCYGKSALLPMMVATATLKPVVGTPLSTSMGVVEATETLAPGCDLARCPTVDPMSAVRHLLRLLAVTHTDYQETLIAFMDETVTQRDGARGKRERKYYDAYKGRAENYRPETVDGVRELTPDEIRQAHEDQKRERETGIPTITPLTEPPAPRGANIYRVDPMAPNIALIEQTADALLQGKIVAFPTETVYGVAADATNTEAVAALRALKGRDTQTPVPLMICDDKQLLQITREIPEAILRNIDQLWPGPMTLALKQSPGAFDHVALDGTLGIRMPDHLLTLTLLSAVARPLAVTSANLTGEPPATNADQVAGYFSARIAMILDGGPTPGPTPSTVLRAVEEPFEILREGLVTRERLVEIFSEDAIR